LCYIEVKGDEAFGVLKWKTNTERRLKTECKICGVGGEWGYQPLAYLREMLAAQFFGPLTSTQAKQCEVFIKELYSLGQERKEVEKSLLPTLASRTTLILQ